MHHTPHTTNTPVIRFSVRIHQRVQLSLIVERVQDIVHFFPDLFVHFYLNWAPARDGFLIPVTFLLPPDVLLSVPKLEEKVVLWRTCPSRDDPVEPLGPDDRNSTSSPRLVYFLGSALV